MYTYILTELVNYADVGIKRLILVHYNIIMSPTPLREIKEGFMMFPSFVDEIKPCKCKGSPINTFTPRDKKKWIKKATI